MTTQQAARQIWERAMQQQAQMLQGGADPNDLGVLILAPGVVRRLLAPGQPAGGLPGDLPSQTSEMGLRMTPIEATLEDNWLKTTPTSTTFGIAKMVSAFGADKLVLYVLSTLDQAVTIQTVGGYVNQPTLLASLINIGSSFSQGAGSTTQSINSIEVYLNQVWHPYLGVTIRTGGTAPTAGRVQVLARGQRWSFGA